MSFAAFRMLRVRRTNRVICTGTGSVGAFPRCPDGRAGKPLVKPPAGNSSLEQAAHEKLPGEPELGIGCTNVKHVLRLPETNRGRPMVLPSAAEWPPHPWFGNTENCPLFSKLRLPAFRIFGNRRGANLEPNRQHIIEPNKNENKSKQLARSLGHRHR